MKRNELIGKLMKEGFTSQTLANMNDKQLNMLSKRILNEQITSTVSTSSSTGNNTPVKNIPKTNTNAVDQAKKGKETFMTYEGEVKEGKKSTPKKKKCDVDETTIDMPVPDLTHVTADLGEDKKSLGVKKNEKIPTSKLNSATKKGGKMGKNPKSDKTLKSLNETDEQKKQTKKDIQEWVEKLVKKRYLCMATKNEIMESIQSKMVMEQHTAPAPVKEPKTKPATRPDEPDVNPGKPDRNPVILPGRPGHRPNILPDPDPKFRETEPVEPEVIPGIEPDVMPDTNPSEPDRNPIILPGKPGHKPGINPDAEPKFEGEPMPEFLSFDALMSAGMGDKLFDEDQMNESVKKIMNKIRKSLN